MCAQAGGERQVVDQGKSVTERCSSVCVFLGGMRQLLVWIQRNLLKERPELFVQGDSVWVTSSCGPGPAAKAQPPCQTWFQLVSVCRSSKEIAGRKPWWNERFGSEMITCVHVCVSADSLQSYRTGWLLYSCLCAGLFIAPSNQPTEKKQDCL